MTGTTPLKRIDGFTAAVRKQPALALLCTACLVLLVYLVLPPVASIAPKGTVELLMVAALAVVMGVGVYRYAGNRLGPEQLLALLIAAGFIMRLGYMVYTHYDVRCHDLPGAYSHTDYMYIIATTGNLPQNNGGEFYHPPLMYLLGAAVYRIAGLFTRNTNVMFDAVRVIPGFASCATLLLSYWLFRELGFSPKAQLIAVAVTAFHPSFIYLSSSINNDMLSIFFMVLVLLFTTRWYRTRSMRHILLLALAMGLGMMTKISVAILALPVGAVFVYAFVQDCRRRTGLIGRRVGQFAAFLAISVPVGMWFPIRNLVRFKQSFTYICPTVLTPLKPSDMLLRFPFYRLFQNIFNDFSNMADHNSYVFMLKTSMFTELQLKGLELPGTALVFFNLLMVALSLAAMAYMYFMMEGPLRFGVGFLGLCWVTQMVAYIEFIAKNPVFCSSDFRYIVITVVTGAAFIAMAYDTWSKRHPKHARKAFYTVGVLTALFCMSSCLVYVGLE